MEYGYIWSGIRVVVSMDGTIMSSKTVVRAEEPVMEEGHWNGQDPRAHLASGRERHSRFAKPQCNADHSWEEFNER